MGLTTEQWTQLRAPFPADAIGKLPKPYKADSPKGNCNVCHGYHGLPAVHLDYVGHAVITNRLNMVDPEWNWTPMGTDAEGNPKLDAEKNLWIWLTIGDKTIPAVGDGKNMKERIGDAIRNGAMRFGVALELWAKEELEDWNIEKGAYAQPETLEDVANIAPEKPKTTRGRKAAEPAPEAAQAPSGDQPASVDERTAVTNQAQYYGFKGAEAKPQVMAVLSRIVGREVKGTAELTSAEAQKAAAEFVQVADVLAQEAIATGMGGIAE